MKCKEDLSIEVLVGLLSPLLPHAPLFCRTLHQHNSPADQARERFKPSKDEASLVVSIKKNMKVLDYSFLWMTS